MKRWTAIAAVILLGACATEAPQRVEAPPPVVAEKPQRMESQPLKHLKGRDVQAMVKSIHTRPLNVKTRCSFRDEVTGSRGKLDVQVAEAEVKRFSAEVFIPKHGMCRFDMKDFAQADKQPVKLTHASSKCAVRMWEQGDRVTVAFNDCPAQCEGDAFDYVWPILVDRKGGRCV